MKQRNIALIGIGILIVFGLCFGTATAAYLVFNTFSRTEIAQITEFDVIDSTQVTPTQTIEPETPLGADVDLQSLFSPFWESYDLLHEDFVEQPIDNQLLAQGALEALITALEEDGLELDSMTPQESAPTAEELAAQAETPEEAFQEFLQFWDTWRLLAYLDTSEEITYETLMRVSLSGMVEALDDPYTGYLDPEQLQQWNTNLDGEYEGIGAWVDTTTEFLTIIAPMPNSPAEKAGLKPGDRIIAIDGEDMIGLDGNIVIRFVLGPAGSKVVLTVSRDGVEDPFDVEVIREKIIIPNVDSEMLEGDIAYLQLFTFSAESYNDLHDALEELLEQNPKALILDLRGNGGGFLHSAVDITSEFIQSGVLLYEEFGDGSRNTHTTRSFEGLATDIPLIVLVDGGTASASEILAGAIQDYERGTLVGTTTFGKGSVQIVPELADGQGALRITIAKWLTPEERHIHGQGLEPDYFVEFTEEEFEQGLDPQLEKALELLQDID